MASNDYLERGYRLVPGLVAPEICKAFMVELQAALDGPQQPITRFRRSSNLLNGDAVEVYGYEYPPMISFLWGLTPAMRDLTGCELLPTYSYFRLYREGDVCRVHSDRYACEHSLSLTLDYSDGVPWPLEVGSERIEPSARVEADFGEERYASLEMNPGDAVLYQGVHHRHGRVAPNPNGWSAHLFLHGSTATAPIANTRSTAMGRRRGPSISRFSGRPPPALSRSAPAHSQPSPTSRPRRRHSA